MLTNLLRALSAVCLLITAQNQASSFQQSSDGSTAPTIRANVRQVLVPIVVTDKHGRPVSGLKQADFLVSEDDVPQRIVAFRKTYDALLDMPNVPAVSSTETKGSKGVMARQVGQDSPTRTYLVCVDTLHSSFGNVVQARHALTKFFQNEHDGKAQYALMNLGRQIEVIQDSTRDPSLVLSALGSKRFESSILDSEASGIAFEAENLRRMLKNYDPQACSNVPAVRDRGTIPDNCPEIKRRVEMFIAARAERTAILTNTFIQELKNIIGVMAGMPTERTLILISDGFNLVPGRELYGIASAYFPEVAQFRFSERDTQVQLDDVLRLAQKNNVIVYGLDSRGVYSPASTGLGDAASEGYGKWNQSRILTQMMSNEDTIAGENGSAMAQLARATGGMYFHDNNDLLGAIRRAFDDERERYVIAYSPSNGWMDGKYRRITVAVKNTNLKVHAKAGYWATGN
jgi:VWFA-related protein